jgi:hypothetical protein
MPTVFSHVVQQRLSQESENIATEALSFILGSSEEARNGMLKLLRGALPELPRLWFRTQEMDGNSRPDMWGNDDEGKPHVFLENKFWAGLTEQQPVSYLKILETQRHPTAMLVVVPSERVGTVWRELSKRLAGAGISTTDKQTATGIVSYVTTNSGPILALTSWSNVLNFLEGETINDPEAKSNLLQLRSLCDQADDDAFIPFSPEEISDQRTAALILRLTSTVQEVMETAFTEVVLYREKLLPQADSTRIGRYAYILDRQRCGVWFGLHFGLWKKHGGTPLWCSFSTSSFGRAPEVRALLEPWASKNGIFIANEPDGSFAIAFDIPLREEKVIVVRRLVELFREIGGALSVLKPKKA